MDFTIINIKLCNLPHNFEHWPSVGKKDALPG